MCELKKGVGSRQMWVPPVYVNRCGPHQGVVPSTSSRCGCTVDVGSENLWGQMEPQGRLRVGVGWRQVCTGNTCIT